MKATAYPKCDKDFSITYFVDGTAEAVFLLSDAGVGYKGDDEALELFKGRDKGKYLKAEVCHGLVWHWWLRSPDVKDSHNARNVRTDGSLYSGNAYNGSGGVRPACVVSSSAPVKKRKSGGYKFDWKR